MGASWKKVDSILQQHEHPHTALLTLLAIQQWNQFSREIVNLVSWNTQLKNRQLLDSCSHQGSRLNTDSPFPSLSF